MAYNEFCSSFHFFPFEETLKIRFLTFIDRVVSFTELYRVLRKSR